MPHKAFIKHNPRIDLCNFALHACQKFATCLTKMATPGRPCCVVAMRSKACADWPKACFRSGERRPTMKLEIQERKNEGIVILDLKGRVVLGPEDSAMRQRLQTFADGHNIIVNLKDVSDIDSTGLGTLVNAALRFREAGGKLVLLHLNDTKGRLPDILKLNTVFETYQDEVEAVNSFFPDRKVPRYDILDFVEEQEQKGASG